MNNAELIRQQTAITVMAGPKGFYGNEMRLVIGPCRPDRVAAMADAQTAADLIELGGFSGACHAWREVWA